MALTINNFWGAETGGLEEVLSTFGTVTAESGNTAHPGSGFAYKVASTSAWFKIDPFAGQVDAGGDYIFGQWVYISAGSASLLGRISDDSDTQEIGFDFLTTNNQIRVAGTTSANDVFVDDEWFFLEIYWERSNSSVIEVWVTDTSGIATNILSLTGVDTLGTGSLGSLRFGGTLTNSPLYDSGYLLSGTTSDADRLGPVEVFAYRSNKASAVADWGRGGGPVKITLDAGTWANAQEIIFNETNTADYTATASAGGLVDCDDVGGSAGTGGPNTDANIDGDSNMKAMKGVWRMKRSGGGATDHTGRIGNSSQAAAGTPDFDPTTAFVNYFFVTTVTLPTASQYISIGLEKSNGGQDYILSDMLAQVLHVPDPPVVGGGIVYKPNKLINNFLVR